MDSREQLRYSAEPGKCNHPADMIIIIKDDNWDEHLPVKEMFYCTKCKTEPESLELMYERTVVQSKRVVNNPRQGVITDKTFRFSVSQKPLRKPYKLTIKSKNEKDSTL